MAIEDHFPIDKAKKLNPIEIRVDRASSEYRLTFVGMDSVLVSRKYRLSEPNRVINTEMMEEKDRVMDILRKSGYIFLDRTIQ